MHHQPLKKLATGALFVALGSAAAIARRDDLPGYPAPNDQQFLQIEVQAGGAVPNGAPPDKMSAAAMANFQVIAIQEQFEVAYFTSLIENITNGEYGYGPYDLPVPVDEGRLLDTLKAIQAQEALHALGAVSILKAFNSTFVPEACTYSFPVASIADSIYLISTVTSLVLGTLQDVTQALAENGDIALARLVASIIGQEGQQNGFFRLVSDLLPAEKPFLTTSVGAYAWSAVQGFLVDCPFDRSVIPLPIFPPLEVLTQAQEQDMTLCFSADLGSYGADFVAGLKSDGLWITYIAGQQLPISVAISSYSVEGTVVTVEADFPWSQNVLDGFIIAALTNKTGFGGPDELPANTLAAPGLIQVEHNSEYQTGGLGIEIHIKE